ncbi:MAG TPA: copper amine oxidase N-terminal domain-containing protein [Syntrophomonas sp.]|nr:copper amine oxidase N-terminal domain-containing protein [Syntrophomonas sp.]HRW12895.1 copper amine oxidase N-terminal domain-containing protein [Syntrophomonas sp.]
MKNYKRDLLIALASLLIVVFGAVTVYGAPSVSTVVQAYTGVKIVYNGTTLTSTSEPYIINNTTYVPIRMLMNQFGKDISWDGDTMQVIIKNSAGENAKDKQIEDLKNEVTALNAKIKGLETALGNADTTLRSIDDALDKYQKTAGTAVTTPVTPGISTGSTLSDFQSNLNKYFEDAGDEYFDDDGIEFSINLSGNTVDLVYDITLDFDDADEYDRLNQISQSDVKTLLNMVKAKITSEVYGTNYKDAKITGKLSDQDNSSYYVKFNGSSYSYSWDENDVIDNVIEALEDEYENGGDVYFGDEDIAFEFEINGDEDDLEYEIHMNFDDAYDYDNLREINKTYVRNFLNKVKSTISDEIEDSDYEDADITGYLYDDDNDDYYVKYNGSSYTFSY